jgi:hypothetical protein
MHHETSVRLGETAPKQLDVDLGVRNGGDLAVFFVRRGGDNGEAHER